jgi:hypothetical protein
VRPLSAAALLFCAACLGKPSPAECVSDSECGAGGICYAGGCRQGSRIDGGIGVCFPLQARFSDINTSYFQVGCGTASNRCHSSDAASGTTVYSGLDLSGDPWSHLVNVHADNLIGRSDVGDRVAPGDPAHSYLLTKIALRSFKDPQLGPGMPPAHPGTDCPEAIEAVRQWIAQGAQHN